ncbi:hypothetical protein HAT2_00401 [Candidatus Similichlamydia laticola]|uniref:Uncharacterized protein n=1 Tax=Candidatus Similichlamydia laticola TaxID=2170265 RepID=A0A369KF57_9BACT|nr:hypothetical protein HAT2_00401 [Candidatus Similichlamydia laticola]
MRVLRIEVSQLWKENKKLKAGHHHVNKKARTWEEDPPNPNTPPKNLS